MGLIFARNIILVTVLTCYIIGQCAGQTIDVCSDTETEVRLCYQLYQPFLYTDLNQSWTQNCQNVECFLQCMADAIRDCDSTDRYFTYDINLLIVSYRAACDKFQINVNALISCELYNYTCLMVSGAMAFAQNASVLYDSSRYVEYKQAYCEYLRHSTACLQSHGSGNCTTELADYYGEFLRVSALPKGCGLPQDHAYFTTYGGPPRCITPYTFETSSETPLQSTFSAISQTNQSDSTLYSTSDTTSETPLQSTFSAISQTNQSDSTLYSSPVTTYTPLSSSTASPNIDCSSVETDFEKCYQLYLSAAQKGDITSVWFQVCQNTECFLQCMIDAIGECDTTDKYFQYDVDVQIVFYRSICNQFNLTVNALTSCHLLNTSCLMSNGAAAVAQQAASYFSSGDYTHYKEAACKYTRLSTDCIQPELTGNCTVDMSNFYEGLLRVSGSLAHCGYPQDHVFFQTYGGSLNCILPNTIGLSDTTNPLSTSTTSLPSTATLLSLTLQTTTTSLLTTAMILSSTPQTTTTSLPTTATPLSSTPQTTTTSLPTTATPLSSTPQTTTTSLPTTSTPLSSTPQAETTSLPTTATLLFSPSQTTTTPRSVPTSKTTTASPLGCSGSVIAAGLAKCFTISLDQISSTYDLLTSYCSDLECNIQCYINAVGQCYTEDQFFVYDTEVYKVTSRAFCNNINETLFSLLNCQMTNLSCLTALTNSIQTEVLQAFKAHDYTTYRQTYCTALTSFQSCVAFAASESCTSTMALQALDFYVASTSYWKCGLQNHEYFTTYGEDVTCSAVTTTWGIVIMIALLAVLLCI